MPILGACAEASAGILLTVTGFYLSPSSGNRDIAFVNRTLARLVVCFAAVAIAWHKHAWICRISRMGAEDPTDGPNRATIAESE